MSITSGRDTSLKGAQVSGETVKADAGRNLTLQSEQGRNNYDSKQTSVSASGNFTFGTMTKLTVETALNAELTEHLGHERNAQNQARIPVTAIHPKPFCAMTAKSS